LALTVEVQECAGGKTGGAGDEEEIRVGLSGAGEDGELGERRAGADTEAAAETVDRIGEVVVAGEGVVVVEERGGADGERAADGEGLAVDGAESAVEVTRVY